MNDLEVELDKAYEARVQHVLNIDIPAWQHGHGDWHTIFLLRCIAKADCQNRERHRDGFPAEVEAYEQWMAGADVEERCEATRWIGR